MLSVILEAGEEKLWGEVGRLSCSRASDEVNERMEDGERPSEGETLPLFKSALVSE
jgi:hypothetical protein